MHTPAAMSCSGCRASPVNAKITATTNDAVDKPISNFLLWNAISRCLLFKVNTPHPVWEGVGIHRVIFN